MKEKKMSAHWDRSQKIGFYYGNAVRDLADQLPADEAVLGQASKSTAGDLLSAMERAEQQVAKLSQAQAELSFLLADLKRMIK